jgi:hypothetical protein
MNELDVIQHELSLGSDLLQSPMFVVYCHSRHILRNVLRVRDPVRQALLHATLPGCLSLPIFRPTGPFLPVLSSSEGCAALLIATSGR